MTEANSFEPTQVTCYSGRTYADRPASFVWQDKQYEVKEVEREWQEPGQKHFVVTARGEKGEKDDKRFELCYIEQDDIWWLKELET